MDRSAKDIATRAGHLRDPAERTRFVEKACAGDPALLQTVHRLLRLQESVTMAGPSASPGVPEATVTADGPAPFRIDAFRTARGEGLPDRVGSYKVLGELGTGAMGVVYLAEQRHPRRRVALKVIRPEAMTPERERRFDLETEALARLRHPGIATIYEAGRADLHGRPHPYFAMELVQGRLLDDHARGLTVRERVRLVASVCDAVAHAHARGILHRDLKPANIIVDEEGRARVLDFGVARSVYAGSTGAGGAGSEEVEAGPRVGELVGTVPYMSPEQLAADPDVDVRTDVYALGVILCEVMTGKRPHDVGGMTVDEALAVVAHAPVIDVEKLGAELGAIVARAVDPERDRRYATVEELATDLRRYLKHEPVAALGGGRAYRLRKLVQRNPVPSALSGVAVLLLVAGTVGVAWQAAVAMRGWEQARLETDRAEAALAGEAEERVRAEGALARAESERRRVHAVNVFMTNMLTSADPSTAMGEELTVRELLDITGRSLSTELREQPGIEATVRMALSNTYIALGEYASAERQSGLMLEVCLARLGEDDPMTADARRTLAQVYAETDRYAEAEALILAAQPVVEASGDRVEAARVRGELARVYFGMGRHDEALALWSGARDELRELLGPDGEHAMVMTHNLCHALKQVGQLTEAEALARDLVERRRRVLGPDNPQTLGAVELLAGLVMSQGREREAVPYQREVLDGRTRILGEQHIATLLTMGNLGATLIRLGELDEAEELTRRSLAAHTEKFGREHSRTMVLLANLAYLIEERGDRAGAVDIYREIIAIRTAAAAGAVDAELWPSMNNLAMILTDLGRYDEADAMYTELLGLCAAAVPETHYILALFRNNHAACLTAMGRLDDARAALEASHPVIEGFFGADHERTRRSLERMAELRRVAGG